MSACKTRFTALLPLVACLVWGGLAGALLWVLCFRTGAVDPLDYKVDVTPWNIDLKIRLGLALTGGIVAGLWYFVRTEKSASPLAGLPLLAGVPLFFYAPTIGTTVFLCWILGWTAIRILPKLHPDSDAIPEWLWMSFSVMLALLLVAGGVLIQYRAMMSLDLRFLDWGIYLDCARQLVRGNGFFTTETGGNFMGSHFEPLTILLLTPFAWIKSPMVFFLFHSVLLYSGAVLVYFLARAVKLNSKEAILIALPVLLSPSLAGLSYARGYGFHDIAFFLPMLAGYFLLLEKRHFRWAWVVFLASLFLKETIPVVWATLGIVFFLQGNRRRGVVLFAVSVLYWLTAVKFFMPMFRGMDSYVMLANFSNLGNSLWQVALSPFLRPGVFWGTLFSPRNLCFWGVLLLPVVWISARRPWLLGGTLVSLGFVCVQKGDWLKSIGMQHHADVLMLFYLTAVYGLAAIKNEEKSGIWERIVFFALNPKDMPRATAKNALIFGSLICAALTYYCFAPGYFGKASKNYYEISAKEKFSHVFDYLESLIPPDIPLNTTLRPGAYFAMRNTVYPSYYANGYLTEDLLFEQFGEYEPWGVYDFVRGWALTHGYRAVFAYSGRNTHLIYLSKRTGLPRCDASVTRPDDREYSQTGELLVSTPGWTIRRRKTPEGVTFFLRLEAVPTGDLSLRAVCVDKTGREILTRRNVFGHGALPAFQAGKHDVMKWEIFLPESLREQVENVRLEVELRPIPGPRPPNFK